MPDQNLISKNLKLLKIDIWVHSILLGICPILFLLTPDKTFSIPNGRSTILEKNYQLFSVLFLMLIIMIIWQIMSWFFHRKFKENYSLITQIIRKFIAFYWIIFLGLFFFQSSTFTFLFLDPTCISAFYFS